MNNRALLRRLANRQFHNVSFADFEGLIEAFGFRLVRIRGSHRLYAHRDIPVSLNIQDDKGEAKPYQLRELLRYVQLYALRLEDDS